jgi:hypothetical protein
MVPARLASALAGRYTLHRPLGRGGMATVYLARDPRYDRAVAVKVLHPKFSTGDTAPRFLRETRIAARLQHPHIAAVLDCGEIAAAADGSGDAATQLLYYVMPGIGNSDDISGGLPKGAAGVRRRQRCRRRRGHRWRVGGLVPGIVRWVLKPGGGRPGRGSRRGICGGERRLGVGGAAPPQAPVS